MLKLNIQKEDIPYQLFPFKYERAIIFTYLNYKEESGFLGFRDNSLIFFSEKNLPKDFEIEIPESDNENQEFIGALGYIGQRLLMHNSFLKIRNFSKQIIDLVDLNDSESIKFFIKPIFDILDNINIRKTQLDALMLQRNI
jgi:hypothetical protein